MLSFKLSAFVCDREVLCLAAPVFVVDADNFERVNHLRRQLEKNNFHCQEVLDNLTYFLCIDFELVLQRNLIGNVRKLFLQQPDVLPNAQRVLLALETAGHFKVNGNGIAKLLAFAGLEANRQVVALRDFLLIADELGRQDSQERPFIDRSQCNSRNAKNKEELQARHFTIAKTFSLSVVAARVVTVTAEVA